MILFVHKVLFTFIQCYFMSKLEQKFVEKSIVVVKVQIPFVYLTFLRRYKIYHKNHFFFLCVTIEATRYMKKPRLEKLKKK